MALSTSNSNPSDLAPVMLDESKEDFIIQGTVSRPNQADFALVTINDSEDRAVREVFGGPLAEQGQNRMVGERGVYEWWQLPGQFPSDQYVVIHGSTGDAKGPLPAIELIRELTRLFNPRYLLLLGTAGGIREKGIEYGRVIFSRQIHAGYQQLLDLPPETAKSCKVEISLFDDPVQPPSDRLYLHAKNAAIDWKPTEAMKEASESASQVVNGLGTSNHEDAPWIGSVLENVKLAMTKPPEATEIFSGSYLVDGKNSELFASIKRTFPKVGAIEMEAGAVGQAVLHSTDTEQFMGYLAIKGISDVVDSDVPAEARKAVRKALGRFASVASAEFAKRIINGWTGNTGRLYGEISLVPPKYMAYLDQELGSKRHSNSIVYDRVDLNRYSEVLNRFCIKERGVRSVWTFCYLAPYRFFAALDDTVLERHLTREAVIQAANAVVSKFGSQKGLLREKLLEHFPHFRVFIDMARRRDCSVVRIMHKGPNWDSENSALLHDFSFVNTGIGYCALDDTELGDDWVRRDQVVLNDDLLFDYDEETKRLVVTCLDAQGLGGEFKRFRQHCERKARNKNIEQILVRNGTVQISEAELPRGEE